MMESSDDLDEDVSVSIVRKPVEEKKWDEEEDDGDSSCEEDLFSRLKNMEDKYAGLQEKVLRHEQVLTGLTKYFKDHRAKILANNEKIGLLESKLEVLELTLKSHLESNHSKPQNPKLSNNVRPKLKNYEILAKSQKTLNLRGPTPPLPVIPDGAVNTLNIVPDVEKRVPNSNKCAEEVHPITSSKGEKQSKLDPVPVPAAFPEVRIYLKRVAVANNKDLAVSTKDLEARPLSPDPSAGGPVKSPGSESKSSGYMSNGAESSPSRNLVPVELPKWRSSQSSARSSSKESSPFRSREVHRSTSVPNNCGVLKPAAANKNLISQTPNAQKPSSSSTNGHPPRRKKRKRRNSWSKKVYKKKKPSSTAPTTVSSPPDPIIPLSDTSSGRRKSGNGDDSDCVVIRHRTNFWSELSDPGGSKSVTPAPVSAPQSSSCGNKADKLECPVCKKSLSYDLKLIHHMKQHELNKELQCKPCHESFSTQFQYLEHRGTAHLNPIKLFACSQCPESYLQRDLLNAHLLSHNESISFKCDICGAEFSKQCELSTHTLIHQKPRFFCQYCDRSFTLRKTLFHHIKSHGVPAQIKQVPCPHCEMKFCSQDSLSYHLKNAHQYSEEALQESSFACSFCPSSFKHILRLLKHLNTSHEAETNVGCCLCGKKFLTVKGLGWHMSCHGINDEEDSDVSA